MLRLVAPPQENCTLQVQQMQTEYARHSKLVRLLVRRRVCGRLPGKGTGGGGTHFVVVPEGVLAVPQHQTRLAHVLVAHKHHLVRQPRTPVERGAPESLVHAHPSLQAAHDPRRRPGHGQLWWLVVQLHVDAVSDR